jgi:hypothetical protein
MNTVKQQHTVTATSILTTKSTYRSLNAQPLSERKVSAQFAIVSDVFSFTVSVPDDTHACCLLR